jgi:hypothetical protein
MTVVAAIQQSIAHEDGRGEMVQPLASASAGKRVAPASACVSGRVARDNRRSRFRQGHCGNLSTMKKWRYALFGWVAWKVTKRFVRRKLP